jgi:uncharacterized protein (DUF488 family)
MEIATIGFTKSTAEHFFERLRRGGVERLVDIRLHNTSQLAGFAKADDLAYFLRAVCGISYERDLRLAPTPALFDGYKKRGGSWDEYEQTFLHLMRERDVPAVLNRDDFQRKTVLLCSEAEPLHCHRRLVAELLAQHWGAHIEHL